MAIIEFLPFVSTESREAKAQSGVATATLYRCFFIGHKVFSLNPFWKPITGFCFFFFFFYHHGILEGGVDKKVLVSYWPQVLLLQVLLAIQTQSLIQEKILKSHLFELGGHGIRPLNTKVVAMFWNKWYMRSVYEGALLKKDNDIVVAQYRNR